MLSQAVASDPRLLAARATYQSKLIEAEGAWSAYQPVIRGTGSSGSSRSQDPLVRGGDKRVYGLELEQPIPLFGRESARVELARVAARVEEFEVKRIEQAVVGELLEAILGIRTATATLEQRDNLANNLLEQTTAVRDTVAGGGMKATEERLMQSRAAQAGALRSRAAADLAAAQAKVKRLLSATPGVQITPQDLRSLWQGALAPDAFEAAALQTAPALQKARAEAEQAGAEYAVTRADLWPKFSLTMQAQRGSFGGIPADSQAIFLGVSVPLFEGGSSLNRVDSAAQRQMAAKERAEQESRMTVQRVAEAWVRWRAADAMALAWRESEHQEEEAVKLTAEQLAGGATTQLGFLRAKQAWLETLVQGVDYRAQQDLAWVRLLQEAGALGLAPTLIKSKEIRWN
jgi:outer membrane protein TolC